MIVRICKTFDFDAAHWLPHVCEGHKCGRLHGHTYRVSVILEGEPDGHMGWFIDYADIAAAWLPIHDDVDHKCLNEVRGLENPTTEALAPWILRRFNASRLAPFMVGVRVYESSSTWCEAMNANASISEKQ